MCKGGFYRNQFEGDYWRSVWCSHMKRHNIETDIPMSHQTLSVIISRVNNLTICGNLRGLTFLDITNTKQMGSNPIYQQAYASQAKVCKYRGYINKVICWKTQIVKWFERMCVGSPPPP
jgi:hypothetical protein